MDHGLSFVAFIEQKFNLVLHMNHILQGIPCTYREGVSLIRLENLPFHYFFKFLVP